MRCRISRSVLAGIRREAALVAPLEGCGLLFGGDDFISGWNGAANVADAPEQRFEIDPATLFAALREARAGGRRLAGYWHSHPSGDAMPSATDAAMAAPDGKLWLIVGEGVLAWRAVERGAVHGRFDPVALEPF
jgi:desampylase